MNIIIVGLGSIGKHYLQLIPKISKKSKIYFIDKIKKDINKKFIQTSFEEIKKKIFYLIMQLYVHLQVYILSILTFLLIEE